jgi:hypothetical protein
MTSNHEPDTTMNDVAGPDGGSARRARRLAVVGATALLIAAGGATAAYATGDDTVQTEYATIVDSTGGGQTEGAQTKGTVGQAESPSSTPGDCPEKQGGGGQQGEGQAPTPESEAAPQAPDTSTL